MTYGSTASGGNTSDPRFATCLYVEVDPATGILDFARAGHPDPAIRMADGTVLIRPTAGGLPLGIDPDADYPTTRLALEPGETVLICTDGLIETRVATTSTPDGAVSATSWSPTTATWRSSPTRWSRACTGPPRTTPGAAGRPARGRHSRAAADRQGKGGGDTVEVPLSPSVRRTALTVAQAEPERISGARQQLREMLHDWACDDQRDSAVLLVSEMLTNVLVHTDADALLVAEVTGGTDDPVGCGSRSPTPATTCRTAAARANWRIPDAG